MLTLYKHTKKQIVYLWKYKDSYRLEVYNKKGFGLVEDIKFRSKAKAVKEFESK